MPRAPRPIKRIKTPSPIVGSDEGLLFQIESQITEKKKELDRMRCDLTYLQRRKRDLQRKMKVLKKDPQ